MQRVRSTTIGSAYQRYARHPASCEIDGEIFTGNYWIAGMILVVSTATENPMKLIFETVAETQKTRWRLLSISQTVV